MRRIGNVEGGIQESASGEVDIRAGGVEVAQFDSSGIRTSMLYRGTQTVPTGKTWTVASGDSAVVGGPVVANGTITVNGTLVVV